jgi:DNA-binding LytR/AlgR family response regulator
MHVLIVEDEILLAKRLQKLLSAVAQDAVVAGITHSVHHTVHWLHSNARPDLILMDIELADGQSFDIFQQVEISSPVIFTTAYDEYAIKAFKVNSIDYLLKPIKEEDLATAIQKFKRLNKPEVDIDALLNGIKAIGSGDKFRDRFLVKMGQKLISVDVENIAYIFSDKGLSYLRTKQNQKYIVDYTMDELEKMLSPQRFFRANRQFIISDLAVEAIHTWFNQKLKVEVKPELAEPVIISRDKANAFKEWMGE